MYMGKIKVNLDNTLRATHCRESFSLPVGRYIKVEAFIRPLLYPSRLVSPGRLLSTLAA